MRLGAATLAILCSATAAHAADGPEDAPTIALTFENDFFASDDFNYTNGTKLSWLSGSHEPKGISRFLANRMDWVGDDAIAWHGFGIGQSLYTPEDILETGPLFDQHPYAAYLYGEYTSMVASNDRLIQFTAQLGVVGPSAAGETTQNFAHELLDGDKAQGWDNQIADEFAIALSLDKRRRYALTFGESDFAVDMIPSIGATVGNYRTDAHAGVTFRLGANLKNDFGPQRVIPGLGGTPYFVSKKGLSWHAFAGFEGRAVAHSIVTDGSFLDDDDPVTVDSEPLVGDAQGGLVVQYGRYQLGYIHVFRSREFQAANGSDEFGALTFAAKLGSW